MALSRILFTGGSGKSTSKKVLGNQGLSTAQRLRAQRAAAAAKSTEKEASNSDEQPQSDDDFGLEYAEEENPGLRFRPRLPATAATEFMEKEASHDEHPNAGDNSGLEYGEGKKPGRTDHHSGGERERSSKVENPIRVVCSQATALLDQLEGAIDRIPKSAPKATSSHPLCVFAGDPVDSIPSAGEEDDGDWPVINSLFKSCFGWGSREAESSAEKLLNRGPFGLDGMVRFLRFFVEERGLSGALFEPKVEALLKALDTR